jgi:hypothetical protein
MRFTVKQAIGAPVVAAVFAAGFVCGSLGQRPAEAQMGGLGDKAMEAAGEQGGALGAAAKLGTSITDMQEHLTALQKNVDALKQVKAALGG